MVKERENHINDNVVRDKIKLYLLAQKLKDVATELDKLSEEDKRIIIERADKKDGIALKGLYNSLNDYIGW
ncbi:hypothetical protein [Wukongibacter baidiensis]